MEQMLLFFFYLPSETDVLLTQNRLLSDKHRLSAAMLGVSEDCDVTTYQWRSMVRRDSSCRACLRAHLGTSFL